MSLIKFSEFLREKFRMEESISNNNFIKNNKMIRKFDKEKNNMSDKEKTKILSGIFDSISSEIKSIEKEFISTLNIISKKYKNSNIYYRTKSLDSIIDKVVGRNKNLSDLGDLLAGTITVESKKDVEKITKDVERKFGNKVLNIETKERGGNNKAGYFGSVHIDLNIGGLQTELQIMTQTLFKQKKLAHRIYSATRTKGANDNDLELMRRFFIKGNLKEELFENFDSFLEFIEEEFHLDL